MQSKKNAQRMNELAQLGLDGAFESHPEIAMEFLALLNESRLADVEKLAKEELARYPDSEWVCESTKSKVTVGTGVKMVLDERAVERNADMMARWELVRAQKAAKIVPVAADLGLSPKKADDLRYFRAEKKTPSVQVKSL